jgi:hypothetical protein
VGEGKVGGVRRWGLIPNGRRERIGNRTGQNKKSKTGVAGTPHRTGTATLIGRRSQAMPVLEVGSSGAQDTAKTTLGGRKRRGWRAACAGSDWWASGRDRADRPPGRVGCWMRCIATPPCGRNSSGCLAVCGLLRGSNSSPGIRWSRRGSTAASFIPRPAGSRAGAYCVRPSGGGCVRVQRNCYMACTVRPDSARVLGQE